MSEWSKWSECSDQCVMYRTRGVRQVGIECPQLTEMKTCCDKDSDDEEDEEEKDAENMRKKMYLRRHIRDWMNDPEPDDEHDKRRMKHIFHRYRNIKPAMKYTNYNNKFT